MSFLEMVFLSDYSLQSAPTPICKLYFLGYEIFNIHNFDALQSRDLCFSKQIVYNCALLLPNVYPGGMLLVLWLNHIFPTNNRVEANEIW